MDRVVVSWPAESEGIVDEPCECLHNEGSVDDVNGIKEVVIVMTFWYVFGTDLVFLNFLNFYSSLGIDHDPHVLYVHMTYVYSFSLCFILRTITWPREVIIVL